KLLLLVGVIGLSGCSTLPSICEGESYNYYKIGAGVKIRETVIYYNGETTNDPISARLELGRRFGACSVGIADHSQWFSGKPFNNKHEYSVQEIFFDYEGRF